MGEKTYTPEEVAERYRVGVKTVWEWLKAGKLHGIKLGRHYRIRTADLEAFEAENAQ